MTGPFGYLMYLKPVGFTFTGDKQDIIMGRGNKQVLDKVLITKICGHRSLAATALILVGTNRNAFYHAPIRSQNHHVLFLDQVFNIDLFDLVNKDLCAPVVPEFLRDFQGFLFNNIQDLFRIRQEILEIGYLGPYLIQFVYDFLGFKAGQLLEAHIKNRLGLLF